MLETSRRPEFELVFVSGRMTLDSMPAASPVGSADVGELESMGAGSRRSAPSDAECAFSMPGTVSEAITPSAFAPPLAAWDSALPELTAPPFGVAF